MYIKTIMKIGSYRKKYLPLIFVFCLLEGVVCVFEGGGGLPPSNNFFIKKVKQLIRNKKNKLHSPLHWLVNPKLNF